jgi:hypothetical protein
MVKESRLASAGAPAGKEVSGNSLAHPARAMAGRSQAQILYPPRTIFLICGFRLVVISSADIIMGMETFQSVGDE